MAVQPQAGVAPPQGNGNVVSGGGGEVGGACSACDAARPMDLVTATVSSASPPRASATRGMKWLGMQGGGWTASTALPLGGRGLG